MPAHHRVAYLGSALVLAVAALAACGGHGTTGLNSVPNSSLQNQLPVALYQNSTTVEESSTLASVATTRHFALTVSTGAKACLPHAGGTGTISSVGSQAEKLHITVAGLPHNTDFDLFIIQVPTAPFGLSWYQGDIDTGSTGTGAGDFVGRFSVETFIVAPGVAPAPVVFHSPIPDAASNPKTGPVHEYHVGLWFNSPADAKKAGCASTVTPFNGTHNAGIQALNTATFPTLAGPLRGFP